MPRTTRAEVYAVLDGERDHQDHRWGTTQVHSVAAFITFIRDYVDEAGHLVTHSDTDDAALVALRKITAMGVACMEAHGAPPRPANQEAAALWDVIGRTPAVAS